MKKLNQNLIEFVLFIFFLFSLIPSKIGNYVFSWDDADYLRVSSCFSNRVLNSDFQNVISCERLIYKAPIFEHIGILVGIILKFFSFFTVVSQEILIKSTLIFLATLNFFILLFLLKQLKSISLKILFVAFFFSLFYNQIVLFMTDTIASLIAAVMVLIHNQKVSNLSYNQKFKFQSILFLLAFGTRTTCAPLFLFVVYAGFCAHNQNRSMFRRAFVQILTLYLVMFYFLLTIWKSVIPSAWTMFNGNQSKYFSLWTDRAQINLIMNTIVTYSLPVLIIICLLLALIKRNSLRKTALEQLIEFLPSLVVAILFLISSSRDPRFLLWPLFSIGYSLFLHLNVKDNKIEFKQKSLTFISVFTLFSMTSFITINESQFGLDRINIIYKQIPKTGNVCPLSDSDSINISKLLFVDNLNNTKLNLNSRVINLPDFAMNERGAKDAIESSKTCSFAYLDNNVTFGSMKNEYTPILISNYIHNNYSTKNLERNITIYFKYLN